MPRKVASAKQGKSPLNLPGRKKNPVSPSFGMTAPPMKKGGKVKQQAEKKGGSIKKKTGGSIDGKCYKKGGSVQVFKKGGSVKKMSQGGSARDGGIM